MSATLAEYRRARIAMELLPRAKRVRATTNSRERWLGSRQLRPQNVRFRWLMLVLLQTAIGIKQARGFRLVDENGTTVPFVPYEQGFVGR